MGNKNSTDLGIFLQKRSINRAEVARKTGLSTARLNQLSNNTTSNLKASELYLIALAIGVDVNTIASEIFKDLKIKNQ